LELIEKKYNGNEHVLSPRSDVVKLARALAQFVRAVKYTSGVSLEFATKDAERALREVADGYPFDCTGCWPRPTVEALKGEEE
jgi:hypothetical protein